ncbi:glycoside hydrolase family 6 protein [Kitasatospora sp. NA04385]|uniref:glycoside hydrolase family 6 protein n=1 Tax=Kitasatospora sp. NA04385 TaxID=2742135 RepID=UPI0015901999|nr:glycoside hydrolase family 6 protein [Kitasatospora sp. NA04385]QKW23745.1 glycoside hydrolase family 6 protein [Kitasatospora sp. NA04385]
MRPSHPVRAALSLAVLLASGLGLATSSQAQAATPGAPGARTLAPDTRFYVDPASKAAQQALTDLKAHDLAGAKAMAQLASWPVAQWFNGTATPKETTDAMVALQAKAALARQVPVTVAYNVPGRDCSQYSAGGASNSTEYAAWIDALARGIGDHRTVVILEPDGLALSPAFCGGTAAQQQDRLAEISAAVTRLERQRGAAVYLDAGHSTWQNVGTQAQLLIDGGVANAQGFFLNVSNYQTDAALTRYGTLVSQCVWYLQNTPGATADSCANQYWPDADADAWYAEHVPAGAKLTHFVIDSSRNGRGPWTPEPGKYTGDPQTWCNPPARGLGTRPTADTGQALLDAFLWIKVPGESDGSCTRGTAGPADPEYGSVDPVAGGWWPEQARSLVADAAPKLTFNTGLFPQH